MGRRVSLRVGLRVELRGEVEGCMARVLKGAIHLAVS